MNYEQKLFRELIINFLSNEGKIVPYKTKQVCNTGRIKLRERERESKENTKTAIKSRNTARLSWTPVILMV